MFPSQEKLAKFILLVIIGTLLSLLAIAKKTKHVNKETEGTKITIFEDELKNSYSKYVYVYGFIHMMTGLYLFLELNINFNKNSSPIILMIILFITAFFEIMGLKVILKEISAMKAIKNGTYYFKITKLTDKIVEKKDNSENYYLYFEEFNEKILATRFQFDSSDIGDEFYIAYIGKTKKVFNRDYYELEDTTKLR